MKSVILAAGLGSRLMPLTRKTPKPLLRIGGKRAIDHVLDGLLSVTDEDVIVTGHLAGLIRRYLNSSRSTAKITFVHNPRFKEGNLLSLLSARKAVGDSPFILLNGDHVFQPGFFEDFIEMAGDLPVSIAIQKRVALEDEMKVRAGRDGKLHAISKDLNDYNGAYIGVTMIRDTTRYWEAAESLRDNTSAPVEEVLRLVNVMCIPVGGIKWAELDTLEDLKKARRLFGE